MGCSGAGWFLEFLFSCKSGAFQRSAQVSFCAPLWKSLLSCWFKSQVLHTSSPTEQGLDESDSVFMSTEMRVSAASGAGASAARASGAGGIVDNIIGISQMSADIYLAACESITSAAQVGPSAKAVSWRRVLHAHIGRGKPDGGRVCASDIKDMSTTTWPAAGGHEAQVLVTVHLPNSFAMDDGLSVGARGLGATKESAMEEACRLVVVELLVRDAFVYPRWRVRLVDNNWKISVPELRRNVAAITRPDENFDVGANACLQAQTATGASCASASIQEVAATGASSTRNCRARDVYEPPAPGHERDRDDLISSALRQMYKAHKKPWLVAGNGLRGHEWRILARLVPPGKMAEWLSRHDDAFELSRIGRGREPAFRPKDPALQHRDPLNGRPVAPTATDSANGVSEITVVARSSRSEAAAEPSAAVDVSVTSPGDHEWNFETTTRSASSWRNDDSEQSYWAEHGNDRWSSTWTGWSREQQAWWSSWNP